MKAKVVVFGSINIDFVISVPLLPQKGETILGQNYQTFSGGKGANQAVAASRMKAQTMLVGAVGTDEYGKQLTANLKKDKIDTTNVLKTKTNTGTAFITVDKTGSNTIIVSPGANSEVSIPVAKKALSKIRKGDIVIAQLEIPVETVTYAFKEAKKKGATTLLNPSPARKLPKELLAATDILVLNETELTVLSESQQNTALETMMKKMAKLGSFSLVVTLGEKGSVLFLNGEAKQFPALKVKSLDTTAAGDAFTGVLAAVLAEEKTLDEAIRFGSIAGALATTKLGAQSSLPLYIDVLAVHKRMK